ncbi:hypothetical protein EG68_10347 [Paragonimus skrjabini miyazakii]|uniref:Uncharacterized protein n=1 Tax=Paragonimus skrjabini miyazakii TaxID=59628 RepID=A0A8S9YGE7_9TREM|nr:hypothetical protein EG68_10347 [Paragonimus skrjabini miyazakii]
MAAHVANKILLILQQIETYQNSTEGLDIDNRKRLGRLLLKAMSLDLEVDTDDVYLEKCVLQNWKAVWKKTMSVLDWARTVVSSRMAEIEIKLVSAIYRIDRGFSSSSTTTYV